MIRLIGFNARLRNFAHVFFEVFLRIDLRYGRRILHLRFLQWLELRLGGAHDFGLDSLRHLFDQRVFLRIVYDTCQALLFHQRVGIVLIHMSVAELP